MGATATVDRVFAEGFVQAIGKGVSPDFTVCVTLDETTPLDEISEEHALLRRYTVQKHLRMLPGEWQYRRESLDSRSATYVFTPVDVEQALAIARECLATAP